jgi:hypothetical protein
MRTRTPVDGLFLAGVDALMLGIAPAALSRLMVAAAVAGPSTFAALRREASRLRHAATPQGGAARPLPVAERSSPG